jgi:acetyl-CoA C-acetyltransferase
MQWQLMPAKWLRKWGLDGKSKINGHQSQMRYQEAKKAGKFQDEIMPIEVKLGKEWLNFKEDEFPRPNTSLEKLSKLAAVYNSPTLTAWNVAGLNDGDAALLLMEKSVAEKLNLTPLATLKNVVSVAGKPRNIATIPAKALNNH